MDHNLNKNLGSEADSLIACHNTQGMEIRATLIRVNRHLVVFEVYNPQVILRMSEVLSDLKIVLNDRLAYTGRAVVSNLVNTGAALVCEATLDDSWLDVDGFAPEKWDEKLRADFDEFIRVSQKSFKVVPDLKVVVADMQTLLLDLRRWMEQVELGVRSQPSGDRLQLERETLDELQRPILPLLGPLFERFEEVCRQIEPEWQPAHRTYVKRQLHPVVLCSPFMYRTFQKPLGYAGDYEMVNMMLRNPYEGGSLFAKILNTFFLNTPPVVAHRNRLAYLSERLVSEACRQERCGGSSKIFNMGCGPANEVQDFLAKSPLCQRTQFTLVDFNDETLMYTGKVLNELKAKHQRATSIQMVKKSVVQLLKEAAKPGSNLFASRYDFVYCAGLFDYLPDHVCEKLMSIFYDLLAPGGLLVATNVEQSNPNRNWMEYSVDWHLVYRDHRRLGALRPKGAAAAACSIKSDATGVNLFMEVRKPEDE